MAKQEKSEQIVVLKDVRLSFPHIFEPQERENDDGSTRTNYNVSLMIPKNSPECKKILAAFKRAADAAKTKAWGADSDNWPKIPSHMVCLKDGDNPDHTDREEYAGHYFVNASTPVDRPPSVITNRKDKDKRWIKAKPGEQGAPYAGCFVNAIVDVWGQKKNSQKNIPNRINASIQTVQFRRDGEPFGAAPIDPNEYLDDDDVSYEGDLDDDGGDDDGLI